MARKWGNLIKIWQDWNPVLKQKMGNREYIRTPKLPKEYHRFSGKMLLRILQETVEFYKQQYSQYNYQGKIRKLHGRKYFVIVRGNINSWKKLQDIPLYIDLETGDWYIPRWYVTKNPKLCAFIIGYRVSAIARIIRRIMGMPEILKERKPAKKPERKKVAIICPKCGQPGFITKRYTKNKDKEYYYVGHKVKLNDKWTTKWHYMGSELPIYVKKQLKGGNE